MTLAATLARCGATNGEMAPSSRGLQVRREEMDAADHRRGNKLERARLAHIDIRESKQPRVELLSDVLLLGFVMWTLIKLHDTMSEKKQTNKNMIFPHTTDYEK